MSLLELLFWLDLVILFYVYGGYLLFTIPFTKQVRNINNGLKPSCTLLIAAYNEEKVIGDKLRNSLNLNYPGNLQVVVVADGSSDRTVQIAQGFPAVKVHFAPERKGKLAAIQRIMATIDSEVVVFTDANCFLNADALNFLVRHFADSKVAGVSGEKKVISAESTAAKESLYWKFESWLKKKDSQFYSVVGAAGELLAIRTNSYTIIPDHLVLDDFIQSMLICEKGLQVVYEPMACASELPSVTIQDEFTRKVRIASGGFQAIQFLRQKLTFHHAPRLRFLYYSHRVFRWTIAPFAFFALLPINILLAMAGSLLFATLLVIHIIIYLFVLLRYKYPWVGRKIPCLDAIQYLIMMQFAVVTGFFRSQRRPQSPTWEKIPRF